MKFAIVLVLLFTMTANAQNSPTVDNGANSVVTAARQFTSADTVRAIHSLFEQKRSSHELILGAAAVFTIGGLVGINSSGYLNKVNQAAGAISLVAAFGFAVFSISRYERFSTKREEQVISAYKAGSLLPSNIRKQLAQTLL